MTKFKTSYDLENDKLHLDGSFLGHFPPHGVLGYIILPCFLLALIWNGDKM